jgi:hypothetical protein
MGRSVVRAFTASLLAACVGVAAIAWQSSGDVAKQMITKWAPQFVLTSLLPPEKPGLSAQSTAPAVEAATANAEPRQPVPLAPTAPERVAPAAASSAEPPPSLQSMARDLASVGQQVEQLKASIEQLKAGQQQMARDVAKASENKSSENKASEQNARARMSALPPRPAAARARRPTAAYPPTQAATAPTLPQAAAPYVPRQFEPQPQAPAQLPAEPGFSSVPRPPMPVR